MRRLLILSTIGAFALNTSMARAESGNAIATQLSTLKEQVKALEEKLTAYEKNQAAASPAGPTSPLTALTAGVQVSGFVDSTYSYNFNRPKSGNNVARVFDHDANSFNVNAAKLAFQKSASAESPVGFRADILAGNDAELIHSAGLGTSGESFDLEQAYAELNVPLSHASSSMNDFSLKVGKFVTLAGAEVIEAKDNWNVSRSLGFGYAIPFTHTGLRGTYVFDNGWDLVLGVNNGWDSFDDNNSGKTFEGHFGFNGLKLPGDSQLTVALNGYVGPELASNDSSQRTLGDVVATYKTPWKPLTLMYNFDYAKQEDGVASGTDATWYSHAAYFKLDLADDWSLAGRGEYFKDDDGYRIVSGTPANYREFTATLEYRPWNGVITRFEYRNDHANESVFEDNDGGSKDSQNTLAGEVIVSF